MTEKFDEKYKEKQDAEAERFIRMIRNSKNVRLPEEKKWWQFWRGTLMTSE